MNVGRAKEILESADVIKVSYEGDLVIIQNVDEATNMARVYYKNNPEMEKDVPVVTLIEES